MAQLPAGPGWTAPIVPWSARARLGIAVAFLENANLPLDGSSRILGRNDPCAVRFTIVRLKLVIDQISEFLIVLSRSPIFFQVDSLDTSPKFASRGMPYFVGFPRAGFLLFDLLATNP